MRTDRDSIIIRSSSIAFSRTRVCGRGRANDYACISDRDVTRPAIACDRSTCIAERRATWGTRHEGGMENSLRSLSLSPYLLHASLSLSFPSLPPPLSHSVFLFFPPPLYLLQPTIACALSACHVAGLINRSDVRIMSLLPLRFLLLPRIRFRRSAKFLSI